MFFSEIIDKLFEEYKSMLSYVDLKIISYYNEIYYDDLYLNEKVQKILSIFHCMIDHYAKIINKVVITKERILNQETSNAILILLKSMNNFFESTLMQQTIITYNLELDFLFNGYNTWLMNDSFSRIPLKINKISIHETSSIYIIKNNVFINTEEKEPNYIGSGCYASVCRITNEELSTDFAKKKLFSKCLSKEKDRFINEYNLMQSFSHNNLMRVYCFYENEMAYIMEYVPYTLEDFIRAKYTLLNRNELIDIILQFLSGLSYLHERNVYHRDLSFKNILVDERNFNNITQYIIKIADFGLAKDPRTELSSSGSVKKGTYIDPCLKLWKDFKEINDIYAVGFIINYIYTGHKNIDSSYKDISELIEKCTTTNLSNRFKSCIEIVSYIQKNLIN